jgi:hypothetical protein
MVQDVAADLGCLRKAFAPITWAIVLARVLNLGGRALGPNFTRPTAPAAVRYTGDTPRGEDASASDSAQHIALGREIEGNCWALFRSDAIDQLVNRAVEHNRLNNTARPIGGCTSERTALMCTDLFASVSYQPNVCFFAADDLC